MENEQPQKDRRGGARPGAGYPKGKKHKGTITKERALAAFKQRVYEDSLNLYEAAKNAALSKEDIRAIELLLNRGYGKPSESIDVTSGGEQIVSFNYIAVPLTASFAVAQALVFIHLEKAGS